MAYSRAHYEFAGPRAPSDFGPKLGLTNLGISIYVFERGEGFDFFHNHREQEEVYLCLEGAVDLKIGDAGKIEVVHLTRGDVVRVDPGTLRAIGNDSAPRGTVLIAGACPHPYPAGYDHHDVIADVLSIVGRGETGYRVPSVFERSTTAIDNSDC
jgi:uncharacterized cupin superfamily protein